MKRKRIVERLYHSLATYNEYVQSYRIMTETDNPAWVESVRFYQGCVDGVQEAIWYLTGDKVVYDYEYTMEDFKRMYPNSKWTA